MPIYTLFFNGKACILLGCIKFLSTEVVRLMNMGFKSIIVNGGGGKGDTALQGTLGKIWRHFLLS